MSFETEAKPDGAGDQNDDQTTDNQQPDSGKPNGEGEPDKGDPSNPKQEPDKKEGEGEEDGKKESDKTPEYSDFEMPEGMELDQGLLDKAIPVFKEMGLTQEQAQQLVSLKAEDVKAQIDAHENQVKQWGEDLKNDKELGGDKYEENVSVARKGLEQFGNKELAEFLDQTGLGNHPEMVRFFRKVGKLTLEDQPGTKNEATANDKSVEDRWYGDSKEG